MRSPTDPKRDKRKQSLYFSADILDELEAEARRLDRSLSWVMQYAWRHGRGAVRALPSVDGVGAA